MAFNDEIMVANGDEQHTGSLSIEHKAEASQNYYSPDDATENTLDDADYIPFYDKSAEAKKNTLLSKIWDYIKGKLGIAESGDTYLKKDGTWGTPAKGSTVSYSASLTSGTTIGTLTIDGTNYTLYCNAGISFDSTEDRRKVLLNTGEWGDAAYQTIGFTSADRYNVMTDGNSTIYEGTSEISSGSTLGQLFNHISFYTTNIKAMYIHGYKNLAYGKSFYNGYISSTGGWVSADATQKEKYCSGITIPANTNALLVKVALLNNSSVQGWVSVAWYQSNGTFISRPQSIGYTTGPVGQIAEFYFYPASGSAIAAVSIRSYGNARVGVYAISNACYNHLNVVQ